MIPFGLKRQTNILFSRPSSFSSPFHSRSNFHFKLSFTRSNYLKNEKIGNGFPQKFVKSFSDKGTNHSENYLGIKNSSLSLKELLKTYSGLSKIKLSALVVITTMVGNVMAPVPFDIVNFIWSSLGTSLAIASANTFNQIIEVDTDAMMKRTLKRSLPTGKISNLHAIAFGLTSGTIGTLILTATVNNLSAVLAFSNILLYALVYTPLKRYHYINTWVGSIVGAIPPMIGWVAATGQLELGAWILGMVMYIWQIPHFLSLSWGYRGDYNRGGYKMLAVTHPQLLPSQTLIWTLALLPLGAISYMANLTTWPFIIDSLIPSGYISWMALDFYRNPIDSKARKLFFSTLYFLPIYFFLMILHKKTQEKLEDDSET